MDDKKKWENKDFVYPLTSGGAKAVISKQGTPSSSSGLLTEFYSSSPTQEKSGHALTIENAKAMFWQEYKQEIRPELQK